MRPRAHFELSDEGAIRPYSRELEGSPGIRKESEIEGDGLGLGLEMMRPAHPPGDEVPTLPKARWNADDYGDLHTA